MPDFVCIFATVKNFLFLRQKPQKKKVALAVEIGDTGVEQKKRNNRRNGSIWNLINTSPKPGLIKI